MGRPHQPGQEAANPTMLGQQLIEVGIVGRTGERIHPGHGRFNYIARHGGEHRLEWIAAAALFQQQAPSLAQCQGRGIEIAQTPHPGLTADILGIDEDARDHDVEQVQHVVLCRCLQRPDKAD